MKVVITGGRDFNEKKYIHEQLDKIHSETPITLLVQGNAIGADILSGMWATKNKIKMLTVKADWDKFGNKAGLIRNIEMADMYDYDMVIAFPGGRGTAHMIEYCESRNMNIIKIPQPPHKTEEQPVASKDPF